MEPQKSHPRTVNGRVIYVRDAEPRDLEAMTTALVDAEGYTGFFDGQTPAERRASTRASLEPFVSAPNNHGLVVSDSPAGEIIGFILFRYYNRHTDTFPSYSILGKLDPALFPSSGDFCQVYDLWVSPARRRQGLATLLKLEMERHMRSRGVAMVYTHTEQSNEHIIALNERLGYRVIRTGPIWDDVIRVSLVKYLEPEE